MDFFPVLMKILFLFAVCFHYVSAVMHTLQYIYTAVPAGISFPEFTAIGLVDREQFMIYRSTDSGSLERAEWMKEFESENYWESLREDMQINQHRFNKTFATVIKAFNHDKGVGIHTLQRMYGCGLHNDGNISGYDLYGYDGEDFIDFYFNVSNVQWDTANDQAKVITQNWDANGYNGHWRTFLEVDCIEQLSKIVSYSGQTWGRKVHAEVSLFAKRSPSPEVVCYATGFFPKALNITWQKDGEDVHEDVELRETLPNQDGSFQKRSILKVPAEELQKHTYTCVVQHSGLEKELVLNVSRMLRGGAPIAIIIAVVGTFGALFTVVTRIVFWKMKEEEEEEEETAEGGGREVGGGGRW